MSSFPSLELELDGEMYVLSPWSCWKVPLGVPSCMSDCQSGTKWGRGGLRPVTQHDFTVVCSFVLSIVNLPSSDMEEMEE
jgi:hypothetical protein